jgi:hypothetical protein
MDDAVVGSGNQCSRLLARQATAAWHYHLFGWFLLAEAVVAGVVYFVLCRILNAARWPSLE